MDIDAKPEKSTPIAKKRAEELIKIREFLKSNLKKAKEMQKKYYNKKHKPRGFQISNKVMIRLKNISTLQPVKKLDHCQLGPFEIINK